MPELRISHRANEKLTLQTLEAAARCGWPNIDLNGFDRGAGIGRTRWEMTPAQISIGYDPLVRSVGEAGLLPDDDMTVEIMIGRDES
jgi:hypothetical protein